MTTSVSPAGPTLDHDRPKTDDPTPLRAVHPPNFPALLRQLGASLLVTTNPAGKLVLVRDEGDPVTVLPGRRYPELINDDEKLLENSFVVPDAALADVPASLRAPAGPTRGAAAPSGNGSVPRESFVKA